MLCSDDLGTGQEWYLVRGHNPKYEHFPKYR